LGSETKASYPGACKQASEHAKVQPEAVLGVLDIAMHLLCLISNDFQWQQLTCAIHAHLGITPYHCMCGYHCQAC